MIHRAATILASGFVKPDLVRVHITSAGAGQICGC
jgi:hypothetical protein